MVSVVVGVCTCYYQGCEYLGGLDTSVYCRRQVVKLLWDDRHLRLKNGLR